LIPGVEWQFIGLSIHGSRKAVSIRCSESLKLRAIDVEVGQVSERKTVRGALKNDLEWLTPCRVPAARTAAWT
jgi:hypothetical protein